MRNTTSFAAILLALGLSAAHAETLEESAARQLAEQGFTNIEVKRDDGLLEVEGWRGEQKVEISYDLTTGDIVKQENEVVPGGKAAHDLDEDRDDNDDSTDDNGGDRDDDDDDDDNDNSGSGSDDDDDRDDSGSDSDDDANDDNGGDRDDDDSDDSDDDSDDHGGDRDDDDSDDVNDDH